VTEIDVFQTISNLVNQTVVNERYRRHDLSPELISQLRRHVPVERIDVTMEQASPAESVVTILAPFFFLFLMFAGVFGTNQQMLTSVIEEKNSRVMEILLAAVSPFQLMAGKILGLTAVGFTLIFFWGGGAIAAAALRGMAGLINAGLVVYFVIYFILGFLVISAILAAIGSVCNTVKEAQSLMAPITMLIVAPMVAWIFIASNPNGTLAIVLSFIPPITPMIMILRLAVEPDLPIWQIGATILLLVATVPAVMWASAKVFRTGILMYGKPPSIRELVRWVRYK
jgi:ABC-2 type transport system permease protein